MAEFSVVDGYIFDPTKSPPPERVFYEGFLSEGDLAIWLGREKHRKTNILLQFAICSALGLDFLRFKFKPKEPLKVVIVDYESKSHSLKRRYDAISDALSLTEEQRKSLKGNLQIIEIRRLIKDGEQFPHFPANPSNKEENIAEMFWNNLVENYPADIYIIDPMRSLHLRDENDSSIEQLLSAIRKMFKQAAVIVAHHMRKRGANPHAILLKQDMRAWSDDARGSSAIKAHADNIICQEREIDKHTEVLYLGAYLKDDADIEPIPLEESDAESFYWQVCPSIPEHLRSIYDALKAAGGKFANKSQAVQTAVGAGIKQSTAYRQFKELGDRGILVESAGQLILTQE